MKPMPFNRRAFLRSAVASNATALNTAHPAAVPPGRTVPTLEPVRTTQSRLTPEEQALIRTAVEQRIAAGERSPL